MNRQKLTELVNHPEQVSQRDIALLSDMAEQYPYATVIQILLAKSKQQQPDARHALATAALYTPNRQVLRQVMENTLPSFGGVPKEAEDTYPNTIPTAEPLESGPTETLQNEGSFLQQATPSDDEGTKVEKQAEPTPLAPAEPVQDPVLTTTLQPEAWLNSEQPPQASTDVFEELQQNLKKLREERSKWQNTEKDSQDQALAKAETDKPQEKQNFSHMPPTIQQVVNEHQQQPLENPRVQQQRSLIDSFLQNAPSLQRKSGADIQQDDEVKDLSETASFTPPDLATETLALIMERQGKTEKAIDIYQKLLLKFPQKSTYFANCIERLKKDL